MPKKVVYQINKEEAGNLESILDLLRKPDQGTLPYYVTKLSDKKFQEKISIYWNGQLLWIDVKKREYLRNLRTDVTRKKLDPTKLMFHAHLRTNNVVQIYVHQTAWDKIKDKLYTWTH